MINKVKLVFFLMLLAAAISCTSKNVENEGDVLEEMTGDEVVGEFGDDEFGDDDDKPDAFADSGPADGASDDLSEFGDTADEGVTPASPTDPTADTTADPTADPTADTTADTTANAASDTTSNLGADDSLADSSSAISPEPSYDNSDFDGLAEAAPAPVMVPLRKVETIPWTQAGVLLNGVYIARENDNFASISTKIYGDSSREAELKKVNPTIARRPMKVGDKIYYNSPRRQTDRTQILFFYEDMGLPPQVYMAQSGENIRTISQNLLGHKDSWKEIWSTNMDVQSKGDLSEPAQLRYWPGEVSAPAIAQTPTPAMPTEPIPPTPAPSFDDFPDDLAQAEPPVNPANNEPPPPAEIPTTPPVQAESPPPPPPASAIGSVGSEGGSALDSLLGGDDQTTALMIGALLLIAAAALFIIIRKRKAKRNIDFQTATHTQIE